MASRSPRLAWLNCTLVVLLLAAIPSAVCRAEDTGLKCLVDPQTGQVSFGGWEGQRLAEITYWDAAEKVQTQSVAPAAGWKIECQPAEGGSHYVCRQEALGLTLRNLEYGGVPLAYFYGHFLRDKAKNWLGQRDYRYDDPQMLGDTVTKLRQVFDDLQRLQHLQLEFLEDYQPLAENVFETTYTGGQRVIVNYADAPHALPSGQTAAPHGYLLVDQGT